MPDIPLSPESSLPESSEPSSSSHQLTAEETEALLLRNLHKKEEEMHEALFELACFYAYSGRQEVTKELFQQLIDRSTTPEQKAQYLLSMGQLMEQRDDFPQAVEYYSQAYILEPTDTNVWYLIHNNLAYSLNQLGRYPEAETYCRLAFQIDSTRCNAFKNLGLSLEGQEDYAEAAHFYMVAIRKNPDEPRSFQHLSNLLEKHPGLLKEHPDLVVELKICGGLFPFLAERIKKLLEKLNG